MARHSLATFHQQQQRITEAIRMGSKLSFVIGCVANKGDPGSFNAVLMRVKDVEPADQE